MNDIIEKSLHNKLISPLKTDDLWKQFMSALAEECSNDYDFYDNIRNTYNPENTDYDTLIECCENFGYTPNLIIDDSIPMIQKELQSVASRIKNKSTYYGYKIIAKQIKLKSEVYNFYWNGKKLIRAIDIDKSLKNANFNSEITAYAEQNFSSIYDGYSMYLDYLENGAKVYTADGLRKYSLDEIVDNKNWNLDKNNKIILTKHLGVEYIPSSVYSKYTQNVGTDNTKLTFEVELSFGNEYVEKSLSIMLDNISYTLTFSDTDDGIEHFTCSSINLIDSTLDLDTYKVTLNFSDYVDESISVSYNSMYIISSNYFHYLENGIKYNKRVPIISHNGCQINAICMEVNGYSHIKSQDIKFTTSYAYDKRFSVLTKYALDKNPAIKFDTAVPWFLDNSTSGSSPSKTEFYYISCGEGKLNMFDSEHIHIFDYNRMVLLYNFDDMDDSFTVDDVSSNNNDCTLVGETKKIKGIIGESVDFNGSTYCKKDDVTLDDTNKTLGFWFNANNDSQHSNTNDMYLFEFYSTTLGIISATWKYSTKKLTVTFGNVVFTNVGNTDPDDDFDLNYNTDYFIAVQLYSSKLSLFVNGQLQFYNKTLTSSIVGSYDLTICNNHNRSLTSGNCYNGLFDSFWIMKDDYSNNNPLEYTKATDLVYLYQNKLSTITHLGRRLNFSELSLQELYDNYVDSEGKTHKNIAINSYIQPNKITNEYSFYPDSRTTNYELNTKFYPLTNYGFKLYYYEQVGTRIQQKTAFGTENGYIYITDTNNIIGKIDYDSGAFELYPKLDRTINQELIYSPNTRSIIAYAIEDVEGVTTYYTDSGYSTTITYDEVDLSTSTETRIEEYTIKGLNNSPLIYTSDKENYYTNRAFTSKIEKYLIDENEDLVVYSHDGGKTVYSDLRVSPIWNDEFLVNSYLINGDSSNTVVYAFGTYDEDNPPTEFYTDLTKQYKIRMWSFTYTSEGNTYTSYAFSKKYVYDISESETPIYYTDLTFSVLYEGNTSSPSLMGLNYTKQALSLTLDTIATNDLIQTYITYEDAVVTIYDKSIMNISVQNTNISKGSMYVSYVYNDVSYIANVDVDGVIDGKGILYGKYDYTNNKLSISFNSKIKHNVTLKYKYQFNTNFCTTKKVTLDYYLKNKIEITELGIEDKNHNLLCYCTFPPIQTNSIRDYISSLFIINKKN